MRLVLIDNYDSFTFNLVQLFLSATEPSCAIDVYRNDEAVAPEDFLTKYNGLIISPGPSGPHNTGICGDLIRTFRGKRPILGVCLGHQLLAWLDGACIEKAPLPRHGKTSLIYHSGTGLLSGLPSPFRAMRYHSLHVPSDQVPSSFRVDATSDDGVIMALSHFSDEIFGVQFHPESFLSEYGALIAKNFLGRCVAYDC